MQPMKENLEEAVSDVNQQPEEEGEKELLRMQK